MTAQRGGLDRLEDRLDAAAGRLADNPRKTLLRWTFGLIAVFVVLGVVFGAIGYVQGWGNEAKRVASPTNVRLQHTQVIGLWESAQRAADNACSAQDSKAGGVDSPTLVEDPAAAYAATYRRIVTDYNRRQQNLFEAKLVGPSGYPSRIPADLQPVGAKADWCGVSAGLRQIHD